MQHCSRPGLYGELQNRMFTKTAWKNALGIHNCLYVHSNTYWNSRSAITDDDKERVRSQSNWFAKSWLTETGLLTADSSNEQRTTTGVYSCAQTQQQLSVIRLRVYSVHKCTVNKNMCLNQNKRHIKNKDSGLRRRGWGVRYGKEGNKNRIVLTFGWSVVSSYVLWTVPMPSIGHHHGQIVIIHLNFLKIWFS